MKQEISSKHLCLIDELRHYALYVMSMKPALQEVTLAFKSSLNGNGLLIELYNPIIFKVSKTTDDDGPFTVGTASVSFIGDHWMQTLESLGYGYRGLDGNFISDLGERMLHFHMEGDICIDVVCESYKILEEIRP